MCYNGEWYYVQSVSPSVVNDIQALPDTPERLKSGIEKLLAQKGEMDFCDVY